MIGRDVLMAMLPEHLLLLGIVLLIVLEIAGLAQRAVADGGAGRRGGRGVGGGPAVLRRLCRGALRRALLGRCGHAAGQGAGAGAGAAGAADVARRIRGRRVPGAAAVLALRRGPDAVGRQLPDAVPRPGDHVAAGVRARAAGLPASAERRSGAQVPGARRHRHRDVPDGRVAAVRRQRLDGHRRLRHGARLGRSDGARRRGAGDPGLLPEGRDRALPCLGAGCLRRRERAGHRLHGRHRQGRRAARRGARVRPGPAWPRRCSNWWRCCRWLPSSGATWRRCASPACAA